MSNRGPVPPLTPFQWFYREGEQSVTQGPSARKPSNTTTTTATATTSTSSTSPMASSSRSLNFLITGAARGIGRGLSRHLLQAGHRVFLVDNDATELQHTTSVHLSPYASSFSARLTNLRDPAEIRFAATAAAQYFNGHIDALINNAAATSLGVGANAFSDLSLDDWNAQLQVNLTAPMLLTQACLPVLRRHEGREGGAVIFMSSTRARQSEPNSEGYAATKAGLLGLSQSLACSLAPFGIRCNAILPGWIHVGNECKQADESGARWEDGLSAEDHGWHFAGRVGNVEDVARTVLYLAESGFVTGQEVVVDGGVTRRMVYPE